MKKHVKPFTYLPKIEAVKEGKITQTIRPEKGISEGDSILFHGYRCKCGAEDWEPLDDFYMKLRCKACGKRMGYATRKWSWRKRVTVIEVVKATAYNWGLEFQDGSKKLWRELDDLAKKDGIDPPKGEMLAEVLKSVYDLYRGKKIEIIRWK